MLLQYSKRKLRYGTIHRIHTVRKSQEGKYVFKGSQEKSGKVMKCQEILLKLEESQEKVRRFYQLNEFCGDQL